MDTRYIFSTWFVYSQLIVNCTVVHFPGCLLCSKPTLKIKQDNAIPNVTEVICEILAKYGLSAEGIPDMLEGYIFIYCLVMTYLMGKPTVLIQNPTFCIFEHP